MWVYEEEVNGRKLTEIINTEHENVKYLPGCKFPHNVVANPSLGDAVKGATLLIFVLPHQVRCACPRHHHHHPIGIHSQFAKPSSTSSYQGCCLRSSPTCTLVLEPFHSSR